MKDLVNGNGSGIKGRLGSSKLQQLSSKELRLVDWTLVLLKGNVFVCFTVLYKHVMAPIPRSLQ